MESKKKSKNKNEKSLTGIVNFIFEAGMLADTPRSGFKFLRSQEQSVAEHSSRVSFIGFALANMVHGVDISKVVMMCLFHDLAEARTGDPNWLNQMYIDRDEKKAIEDCTKNLVFGDGIKEIIAEYEERKSIESLLTKDADTLELLLRLKELMDIGNKRAEKWVPGLLERLMTKEGKMIAKKIMETESDAWYFDQKDTWWTNRKK